MKLKATDVLRSSALAVVLIVILACMDTRSAIAQGGIEEAKLKPPGWSHGTVFNFGIYDQSLIRVGSAAYKIELDPDMGLNNYTIRYSAKSADMAEASTCIVDKKTLLPARSTRKLIRRGSTWYQNAFYTANGVTVSTKRDEGAIVEQKLPVGSGDKLYDFEEMALIVPQIDWQRTNKVYFYLFTASRATTSWVVVENLGDATVTWKDKIWKCRKLSMKSDFGDQLMFTTVVGSRTIIAKYDMGSYVFLNLDIPSTGTVADIEGEVSLEQAITMTQ
jgi:hypothetical protein